MIDWRTPQQQAVYRYATNKTIDNGWQGMALGRSLLCQSRLKMVMAKIQFESRFKIHKSECTLQYSRLYMAWKLAFKGFEALSIQRYNKSFHNRFHREKKNRTLQLRCEPFRMAVHKRTTSLYTGRWWRNEKGTTEPDLSNRPQKVRVITAVGNG
jgi:hypothetical protein